MSEAGQKMPPAVTVASALFVVYGVLGVISGLLYWLLRGHSALSWQFVVLLLAFAALYLLIGVKLWQLRYWALIAGRILALWSGASYVLLFATGRFAVTPPVLTLARVTQFMVAIALAIMVFLPAVSRAVKRPEGSKTGERYSR